MGKNKVHTGSTRSLSILQYIKEEIFLDRSPSRRFPAGLLNFCWFYRNRVQKEFTSKIAFNLTSLSSGYSSPPAMGAGGGGGGGGNGGNQTLFPEAEFLDVNGTKVLRVFLHAIHSHL
jgi:hypothetical protein